MSFDERKRRAKAFEKRAGGYIKQQFPDYRIEKQKIFASGRRPDYWGVHKQDHRDRVAFEVKTHPQAHRVQESDLKQLRMYQHHGIAQRGVLVVPDSVRVPREVRRRARGSGQEIVKVPEEGCFIATAAFGTPLANEIDVLRIIRDKHIKRTQFGQEVVQTYYRISPPISNAVAKSPILRRIIRDSVRSVLYVLKALS